MRKKNIVTAVQLRRLILMQFVSVIFSAKLWLSCQLFKTDMVGFVAFIAKPEGLHIEIMYLSPLLSFILQTHTVLSHEVIMLYIRGVDVLHT